MNPGPKKQEEKQRNGIDPNLSERASVSEPYPRPFTLETFILITNSLLILTEFVVPEGLLASNPVKIFHFRRHGRNKICVHEANPTPLSLECRQAVGFRSCTLQILQRHPRVVLVSNFIPDIPIRRQKRV